ncbi:MAG: hypothetical protein GX237_01170 [Clostridiales bacterium]|mgnify:CR=1 FL=1|nr:hypothetical protein [Clostridiales bacterium]
MKSFLYNMGYFLKETGRIIKLNLLSNVFSVIGTALILFLLGVVITGTNIGNRLVVMLSEEAEINGYFSEITMEEREKLVKKVNKINGVRSVRLVDEIEAKDRMEDILGDEASILELFEDNPFEAFIEIRIDLNLIDNILNDLKTMKEIEYVRDNREVLKSIEDITSGLKLLGYLMMVAVGITTIIILSHMIRQGIYNNKDQINTLRLLGSPSAFIGFPYILTGILLTLLGGIIATVSIVLLINLLYESFAGTIPFMPLPPRSQLLDKMTLLITSISLLLGFVGSLFGLSSIRER